MLGDNGLHAFFDFGELRFIAIREHGCGDKLAHHVEVFGIEAARGSSRRTHANAARHKRAAGLVGNGVLVHGKADAFKQLFGVFAGHMGLDCVVQGLIITVLVLASFFVGVYFDMGYIHIADMIAGNADEEGVMMAFITLNMVEIFHCFNMRSRRASLFTMKKQNKWLWASAALALVLTVIVTVQPTLAEMFFGPVTLEFKGVVAALGLAFLIIPLMEIYKAIMRAVEKE